MPAQKKANASPAEAKRLLADATTSAHSLLLATKELLGEQFYAWEPESIWTDYEHIGLDVPVINQCKVQAGLTLLFVPLFFWDAVVFEKTALAFNNLTPNPEALQEASPAQLAWAVEEATLIVHKHHVHETRQFEYEPKVYAGTVLHRAGYALAPPQLAFAQTHLDRLNHHSAAGLRKKVEARLPELTKEGYADHPFQETEEDVQLGYLAAVKLYITEKKAALHAEVAALGL